MSTTVLHLTATRFIRPMKVGRTGALLLGCEDAKAKPHEVVVKLRGPEITVKSQIAELICALLAHDLGLDVPTPAVVDMPVGFEAVVASPAVAAAIKASPGINFGSLLLEAFTPWPTDRPLIGAMRDRAATIFAFDALIQNPDRRIDGVTSNLWSRSDTIGVFDHEMALRFLYLSLGAFACPWVPADQIASFDFLKRHVFYAALRSRPVDLDTFEDGLRKLTTARIDGYVRAVPKEWQSGHTFCQDIAHYLDAARKKRATIIAFLKHFLL
jgi:hypothetical protein